MLCEENLFLKQQIAKLTEANEFNLKYRDLVNSLGEIVLVAQDNRIVYGNRKLEENLRLSLEEISSVPFSSFIHPDDRKIVMENYKRRMSDQDFSKTYPFRIFNKKSNGYHWVKVSAVHILWHDQPATLNILTDIHERVIAENELIIAKNKAVEAAKNETRFLTNMSKEIKIPMNDIIGTTQSLLDTSINEIQEHYLTSIKDSSKHLINVIDETLDYSCIQAGKMTFSTDSFDLLSSIKQLINSLSSLTDNKDITFELNISANVPQFLFGDQTRIIQILSNLLSNAIIFTNKGSVTLSVKPSDDEQNIIFEIQDTGIGISENIKKSIENSITEFDYLESRIENGTGLSLVLSKQLAALMRGTLTYKSSTEEGTTFTLTLPITPSKTKSNDASLHNKDYGFNVHIVEDNDTNYFVIQRFLKKLGCHSTRSIDGYDAIEEIEKNKYDMIFMDIQLPGINGCETTKIIRELSHCKEIPIIAMTANTKKQDKKQCFDAGMDHFLSKPIEFKKLPTILDKFGALL